MASPKGFEKLIDEIGSMSVLELSEFVKAFEEKFGVSAAMPIAGAVAVSSSGGEQKVVAEEKATYKVTLKDGGADKIKAIKAVRALKKDMGLSEAKKLVEEVPALLAENVSKEEAEKMKRELEAAGAKVELS